MPRWSLPVLCNLALLACSLQPHQQQLAHGRFEQVVLSVPDAARSVVLMLAPPGDARADALTAQLVPRAALVARIDAERFARVLDTSPSSCAFPSGDLDNLARFIQAYSKLPSYEPAILVGLGVGAELAAGALAQAPPGTFTGAIVLDDCNRRLQQPLCGRAASAASSPAPSPAAAASPASTPGSLAAAAALPLDASHSPSSAGDPLFSLRPDAARCPATSTAPVEPTGDERRFTELFEQLSSLARARAVRSPAGLGDLPLVEVPATGPEHADTFAVLLSGDGGWAGIDEAISARLAQSGLSVVGIDSLRYFWRERTPESTAGDVQRVIAHYRSTWKRPRVVLIGFSQGADVLPFILNRLSGESRGAVVRAVGLSLSTTATFEFHLASWAGASGDRPTMPEVQRLARDTLVCVYGKDDPEALCPELDPSRFRVVQLPGSHHFNGDYARVSAVVLDGLSAR